LAELIDFAEFLRQKTALHQSSGSGSLLESDGRPGEFSYICGQPFRNSEKNAP